MKLNGSAWGRRTSSGGMIGPLRSQREHFPDARRERRCGIGGANEVEGGHHLIASIILRRSMAFRRQVWRKQLQTGEVRLCSISFVHQLLNTTCLTSGREVPRVRV